MSNSSCKSAAKLFNFFWILFTMKLLIVIDLSLLLVVASKANGKRWNVNITTELNATIGSDVTIPCTFTSSDGTKPDVFWKIKQRSEVEINELEKNAFIYHPNDTFVLKAFKGRTQLIGNKEERDCSLLICDVQENIQGIYVRLVLGSVKHSYLDTTVSILAVNATVKKESEDSSFPILAISLSIAALLIIISVAGIVFCIKCKRSSTVSRENSEYYVNFRKTSSNQGNREPSLNTQDKWKTIDDPIYINMEVHSAQMDQSMDDRDNIYANVDYSK